MDLLLSSSSCILLSFLLLFVTSPVPKVKGLEFKYHDHEEVHSFLVNVSLAYPNITRLHTIGQSVEGRELWVIVIGQSPHEHVTLRPNVKYIANIHGDETVGREMLLQLVELLVSNYGHNDTITRLLDSTTIHIMPTLNPDGFAIANKSDCRAPQGRKNANNLDLNRNFPDFFRKNTAPIERETAAIIKWIGQTRFVLSASLHTGVLVANYPLDNYRPTAQNQTGPSISPDDDVFQHLAKTYSFAHRKMHRTKSCGPNTTVFENGITNGAAWFAVLGGMQDYNYFYASCYELTLELACCTPLASQLAEYWEDNRPALLAYIMTVHMGVKGLVTDQNKMALKDAAIVIEGRELAPFRTSPYGEYWKLLLPGSYVLVVSKDGYQTKRVSFKVSENSVTRLDVVLSPPAAENSPAPCSSSPPTSLPTITPLLLLLFLFSLI